MRLRPTPALLLVTAALAAQGSALIGAGQAALAFGAAQAGATAWVLRRATGRRLAWLAAPVLLAALAMGGLRGLGAASQTLVFLLLLAWFGGSLRRGRTPLVTRWAWRLTPGFHVGMEAYTRAVTWAWCAAFAAGVALAMLRPGWPAPALMLVVALAERALRGLRFPGMSHTSLPTIIRAVRADIAARAAAAPHAAGSATHCP